VAYRLSGHLDMLSYKLLFAVYLLTGLSYALAVLLPLSRLLQLL